MIILCIIIFHDSYAHLGTMIARGDCCDHFDQLAEYQVSKLFCIQ